MVQIIQSTKEPAPWAFEPEEWLCLGRGCPTNTPGEDDAGFEVIHVQPNERRGVCAPGGQTEAASPGGGQELRPARSPVRRRTCRGPPSLRVPKPMRVRAALSDLRAAYLPPQRSAPKFGQVGRRSGACQRYRTGEGEVDMRHEGVRQGGSRRSTPF